MLLNIPDFRSEARDRIYGYTVDPNRYPDWVCSDLQRLRALMYVLCSVGMGTDSAPRDNIWGAQAIVAGVLATVKGGIICQVRNLVYRARSDADFALFSFIESEENAILDSLGQEFLDLFKSLMLPRRCNGTELDGPYYLSEFRYFWDNEFLPTANADSVDRLRQDVHPQAVELREQLCPEVLEAVRRCENGMRVQTARVCDYLRENKPR